MSDPVTSPPAADETVVVSAVDMLAAAASPDDVPDLPRIDFEVLGKDRFNITFRTTQIFPVKAHVYLMTRGEDHDLEIQVTLRSAFVLPDDRIEYTGTLDGAPAGFADWSGDVWLRDYHPMDDAGDAEAGEVTDKRDGKRLPRTFQVMSPNLLRFKALTSDISRTGIRLMADEALPVGKKLDLTMDFDDTRYPHMKCQAVVVWCRPRDRRTWWAGLKFTTIDDEDRAVIEEYISHCIQRAQTSKGTL